MPELRFKKPANMRRLAIDLMSVPGVRVPSTIPAPGGSSGYRSLLSAGYDSQTQEIVLYVDDAAPQTVIDAITAAVAAHDPTPDPVPDDPNFGSEGTDAGAFQLATKVQQGQAYLDLAAPTNAQTVAAVKGLIRLVFYMGYKLKKANLI